MSSPEQIQAEIERTRSHLSTDVDRLTDKVSPSAIVNRRVGRVKGAASSVREKVMGAADHAKGGVGSAGSSLSDTASNLTGTAAYAPEAVTQRAQGNPLAAGLIAFGVGMLLSSLAPASEAEQQLAAQAQDKATQLAGPVKETAQEVAENLKEPAQQAVESIKSTATDAASEAADHAKSAAQDVKEPLQQ